MQLELVRLKSLILVIMFAELLSQSDITVQLQPYST